MNQSKPIPQHADTVHSPSFTGNLQRASLLPGEIAVRPPDDGKTQATAGAEGYPKPAGASIYRRHFINVRWPHQGGSHMTRGVRRSWWHWPAIAAMVGMAVWGLILVMSDSAAGDNISLMLRKLI